MTHGMISAPQPEAVEAGLDALKAGGNAVDAAIACALVQTAVDPQMCGIAGFGNMQVYLPGSGVHTTLDFHGRAPLSARPDMWEHLIEREASDGWGFILKGRVNEYGYGAISSPRSLAAFEAALTRWGTMSLSDLLQPAIGYCEDGFTVRPHVREYWDKPPEAGRDGTIGMMTNVAATRKIYCHDDGSLYRVGEVLKNPDMGRTYRRIAENGIAEFYSGGTADRIVSDMQANGGMLSHADLKTCAPEENPPLKGTYRGFEIASNQPPGGGIQLIEMLNILENFDLAALGHNSPEYIRVVAEAMKIATIDKDRHVGDPKFVDVPVERLTSKAYAAEMAEAIRRGDKAHVERLNPGGTESKNTTHISVVDAAGNCVTMTHTLGNPSGVVTEGLGFQYNNAMVLFDPNPGGPNSIAPGRVRQHGTAACIVKKDGAPVMAIGAPGGHGICSGVVQVISNVIDFAMTPVEAVSAPRVHAEGDVVEAEARIPRSVIADLTAKGHEVKHSVYSYDYTSGRPHLATRAPETGQLGGAADPRGGGMIIRS